MALIDKNTSLFATPEGQKVAREIKKGCMQSGKCPTCFCKEDCDLYIPMIAPR